MKSPSWMRTLLAGAAAVLLAACGPGVGGSGTGEDQSPPPVLGASAAALCASELAPVLACAPGANPGLNPGTARLAFLGTLGGNPVSLVLEGNSAELRIGCTLLRFRGAWGQLGGQPPRFYGYTDPDGRPVVATMQAQLVAGEIELTLRDANGTAIAGPLRVQAGEAPGCG